MKTDYVLSAYVDGRIVLVRHYNTYAGMIINWICLAIFKYRSANFVVQKIDY